MLPGVELMACQGLAVQAEVMHHVVRVESSYNPYAIGVVGGRLARQPRNLPEALATVRMLEGLGYNFSIGLAQVNRYNLEKYGLGSYERAFEPCANLKAGSEILAECHRRAGGDWGKSFSCYYSGNFSTGFRHGYVQKVYASLRAARGASTAPASASGAIPVIGRSERRSVPIERHPLHETPGRGPGSEAIAGAGAVPSRTQAVPGRVDARPAEMTVAPAQAAFAAEAVGLPIGQGGEPHAAGTPLVARAVPTADVGIARVVATPVSPASPPPTTAAPDRAFVAGETEPDAALVF